MRTATPATRSGGQPGGAAAIARRMFVAAVLAFAAGCDLVGSQEASEPPSEPGTESAAEGAEATAGPDESAPDSEAPPGEGELVVGDGDPELLEELGRIATQVADLRGLDILQSIHLDVVSEGELLEIHRELRDEFDRDEERLALREERQRTLETLYLLPEGLDLDEALDDLVEVGVLGLFSPRTERAYAVAHDGELTPAVTATVAHELLHAIQHQHVGLDHLEDLEEPDEYFAHSSLIEGDAVIVEEAWVDAFLDDEQSQERDATLARLGIEAQAVLETIPDYILLKQLLPYQFGQRFVTALLDEGGQERLDATLADPPRTSVEIYDPQLFLDGFTPRDAPPLHDPGGWEGFHATSFGAWQVDVFSFTATPGRSPIGQHWRGGALRAWSDGDDATAAAFSTTFDGSAAGTFCERLPNWYEEHAQATVTAPAGADGGPSRTELSTDRGVVVVDCTTTDVRVAAAPDADVAAAILDGP